MAMRLKQSSLALLSVLVFLLCTGFSAHAEWFLQYNPDPDPNANQLRAVWGSSGTGIFAVGEYGTILRTTDNGATWDNMTVGGPVIPQTLYGVWGSSATDVFAVADGGKIIHYNGTTWSTMTSTVTSRLRDVWGFSATDVFVVGEGGKILHYNGSEWSSMASPTTLTLQGVWGTANTNIYAVGGPSAASPGNGARIIKYNGSSWTEVLNSSQIERFHDVWGSDADNVFVVGEGGAIVHTIDGGASWTSMSNPVQGSSVNFRDIWGNSATDIFAVGDGDPLADYGSTILHYDGIVWSIMPNQRETTATKLHGICGISGSNVFAVGDRYIEPDGITVHGTILHFINAQPQASFAVVPASGELSTVFRVDASGSTDDKDTLAKLMFRWDWQGNGNWTGFSDNSTAEHQYTSPGSYTIRLQVKDTDNLTDNATQTITVAPPPTTSTSSIPGGGGGGGGGGGSSPTTTTSSVMTTTTTSVVPTTSTTTSVQEPPPETTTTAVSSTTTTAPACPLRNALGDESGRELRALRQYRDAVLLKTAPGIVYTSLYYIHGPEIIKIFAEHQALAEECRLLVRDIVPEIEHGLAGNTPVRLSAARHRTIMHVIADIRRHASSELCKTLDATAEMLYSGKGEPLFSVHIEKE